MKNFKKEEKKTLLSREVRRLKKKRWKEDKRDKERELERERERVNRKGNYIISISELLIAFEVTLDR